MSAYVRFPTKPTSSGRLNWLSVIGYDPVNSYRFVSDCPVMYDDCLPYTVFV